MRRHAAVAFAAMAVALAATSAAMAPPRTGLFVTAKSLGGVSLGMTKAELLRAWGKRHGVCRECEVPTWYFNYRQFEPQGAGVEFHRGRVSRVFTVWQPEGWRSRSGVGLGDDAGKVSDLEGPYEERGCLNYRALVTRKGNVQSVLYVFRDRVWGFGLMRAGQSPCV